MATGGAQLGKYQLIRRIATGGMAELFLARASAIHGFEKLVVLKRILPQHAESDDFIRMFLAEARLAATLHHPNIVQVYDIGEQDAAYFFTMEFVQGQDLRRVVRAARKAQRVLPLEHILHVVMGVAAGLHHAHEKIGLDGRPLGIVHRDVSPSNVLVTYEGGVKIVDFGIAKAATAQTVTAAGTLKGKIPYMSPEQCRGESVDQRSDIFSIGTLLWELTTGSRLFTGDNEFAIINKVAAGDVPAPSSVRGDYPPELEAIVMRALQSDREQRYGSALDLQIDLEDFAREARLPVSSARMAKFMRELFGSEIRALNASLSDRLDEQPTMPRPALSKEVLAAAISMPPVEAVEAGTELTPSEVIANQAQITPGPEPSLRVGSATDISYEPRRPGGLAIALAVLTGMVVVLGLATAFYFLFLAKPDAKVDAPAEQETIIVESPAVVDDEPPDDPEDDQPPASAEDDGGPADLDLTEPGDPSEATPPETTTPVVDEDEPPEPSPPPKDDKTEPKVDPGRSKPSSKPTKTGGKPSGKRGGTKGTTEPKPKWDPNSPFPI